MNVNRLNKGIEDYGEHQDRTESLVSTKWKVISFEVGHVLCVGRLGGDRRMCVHEDDTCMET